MKKSKRIVLGVLLAGSLLVGGQTAFADSGYGWRGGEIRRDYAAIERAKHRLYLDQIELRRDLRNGASPAEIAYDRRQIARSRRILADAYAELERDRGGHDWHRSGWSSGYNW